MDLEKKQALLKHFLAFSRSPAKEWLLEEARKVLVTKRQELQVLLKECKDPSKIFRQGGILDGYTEALNLFDKLQESLGEKEEKKDKPLY